MSAAKIVGGLLALVGGVFILLQVLDVWSYFLTGPEETTGIIVNLALAGIAIVGGILGLVGKTMGGILAIIVGALAIVFGIITVYITQTELIWPMSFFTTTLGWFPAPVHLFAGISIESLLILGGGITIIAGGSSK